MADQKLQIVVEVDSTGAVTGFSKVQSSVEELQGELKTTQDNFTQTESSFSRLGSLATPLIGVIAGIAGAFASVAAVKAGAEIGDISSAFDQLSQKAGTTSDVLLNRLNTATGETVRNLDLMKLANQGLQAGLKPEALEAAAKAARSYADSVGTDAKQELDAFISGLSRGNDAFLKSRGIIIDNEKAFQIYADSLGIAADKLDEVQKAEAIRAAATQALIEKTKSLGETQNDTADAFDKFSKLLSDKRDAFLQAIGTNQELGNAVDLLAEQIKKFDVTPLINGLSKIITFTSSTITALADLADNVNVVNKYLQNPFDGLEAAFGAAQQEKRTLANSKFNASLKDLSKELQTSDKILRAISEGAKFSEKDFQKFKLQVEDLKKAIVDSGVPQSKYAKAFEEIDRKVNTLRNLYSADFPNAIENVSNKLEDSAEKVSKTKNKVDELRTSIVKSPEQFGAFAGPIAECADKAIKSFEEIELEAGNAASNIQQQFVDAFGTLGAALGSGNFKDALQGVVGDFSKIISDELSTSLGSMLGESFGSLGGPLGSLVGNFIGSRLGEDIKKALGGDFKQLVSDQVNLILPGAGFLTDKLFGGESAGTAGRKAADKYFADIFAANRLSIIIDGQLKQVSDIVFKGNQEGGLFAGLPAATQAAFEGVGVAFQGMLGIANDIGVNIGNVLANNVGGSLNNLQLLVASTGLSFDDMAKQVEDAFLKGTLSATEAQAALVGIQQIAEDGIPGAMGAVQDAFENVFAAGAHGGAALVDALKDIGFEAKELGIRDIGGLKVKLEEFVQAGKFTQTQLDQYFAALAKNGISSVDQLTKATTSQLLGIAADLQNAGVLEDSKSLIDNLNNLPSEKTVRINVDTRFIGDKAAAQALSDSGVKFGAEPGRAGA